MSDISSQQMDDLLAALNKTAGSLGKMVDGMSSPQRSRPMSRSAANATLTNDLNKAKKNEIKGLADHFMRVKESTTAFNALRSTLLKTTEAFIGLKVITKIFDYAKEEIKTYQDLSNYGQNFGGSMLKMSEQAAAAGLPLETFAKLIKNNNVVVGQMGVQSFMNLNKQVRGLTEQSGMYGFTMEQLGDLTGSYLDMQRLAGNNLKNLTGPRTAKDIADFALNLTTMSDVLGAQREQVLKNAQDAMSDASFMGQESINTAMGMASANKSMQAAITDLSAQSGEAGKALPNMLAQAFGSPGGANFTDFGQTLIKNGLGDLAGSIDQANQQIQAGGDSHAIIADLVTQFKTRIMNPDEIRSLQTLAMAGDKSAAEILAVGANLKTYTAADRAKSEKNAKTMDTFTAFFADFESIFQGIKSSFVDGFLTPFMTMGQLDPKTVKEFWESIDKNLKPAMNALGLSMGGFVKDFMKPENIKAVVGTISSLVNLGASLLKIGATLTNVLAPIVKKIADVFAWLDKKLGNFATGLLMLTALIAGPILMKMIVSKIMGMFVSPKPVFVRGSIVNVYGGGGSGGGLGGGGGAGRMAEAGEARMLTAEELAMADAGILTKASPLTKIGKEGGMFSKVLGGAGKIGGKIGGKLGGKLLGRLGGAFLPGVGAALDLKGAMDAAQDGNFLASGLYGLGGAINGVGAVADATGIGALAGVPLDAIGGIVSGLGVASDVTGFGKGWFQKKKAAAVDPKNLAVPTDAAFTDQPAGPDDNALAQLRTEAILGNKESLDMLKKIQEGQDKQTAILANQQKQITDAQKATAAAIKNGQGYG